MGFRKRASGVVSFCSKGLGWAFREILPVVGVLGILSFIIGGPVYLIRTHEKSMAIKKERKARGEQEWRDNLPKPRYVHGEKVHIKANDSFAIVKSIWPANHDGYYKYEITYSDNTGQIHSAEVWEWEMTDEKDE